jgi:hypothetical protein
VNQILKFKLDNALALTLITEFHVTIDFSSDSTKHVHTRFAPGELLI